MKLTGTNLIVIVKSLVFASGNEVPYNLVVQPDAVVEVSKPYRSVVVCDRPVFLEAQAPVNGFIVSVPLIIVCESSSEMGCDETYAGVGKVETDGTATLVTGNP